MSFRIWITTALSVLQVNEIGQLASTAKQLETSTDILRKFSSPYRARLRVYNLQASVLSKKFTQKGKGGRE